MLLPLLAAAGPDEPPGPLTPREPEIEPPPSPPLAPPTPQEPEIRPPAEPPTQPDPGVLPPGVPFREPEPEPDVPDGPGITDPDLAPGVPLSPPEYAPEPAPRRRPPSPDRMDSDDEDGDVPFDTASLPPDHPAYDRVQNRRPQDKGGRVGGILTAFALIAAGLLIAYVLVRPDPAPADVHDLLSVAAAHAETVALDVMTGDLDQAEEYIIGEFGWPIRVPVLPDARLEGVGVETLVEGVEVPVLGYRTAADEPIIVYAYDYAFLDAAADRLRLTQPVYARLADDPPVDVRRVGESYLVLWRRRAAIYTAVTTSDPAPLVEYLRRR